MFLVIAWKLEAGLSLPSLHSRRLAKRPDQEELITRLLETSQGTPQTNSAQTYGLWPMPSTADAAFSMSRARPSSLA